MLEISADGARFDLVASTLRDLGDRGLNRDLARGLDRVAEKLTEDARRAALERLPRRGGLAQRVADSPMLTQRKRGSNPGVSIRAKGMRELRLIDSGLVRHPVYGNRDVRSVQRVTPGWFTAPMEAGRDDAIRAIDKVLDDVVAKIARRLNSN